MFAASVFAQIFESSIAQTPEVRWVFMDCLVLGAPEGILDMTHEAIARRTNVPVQIIRWAITELEKPDPQSRSTDNNGARLVRLDAARDWGWRIVNYDKYRTLANGESGNRPSSLAVQPSWEEWWTVCQMVGLPEWKARDEFLKQEAKDEPWKGARGNLNAHAARVRCWWQAEGAPMQAGKLASSSFWQLKTELDLIQREIELIEMRSTKDVFGSFVIDVPNKENYRRLRTRRCELKVALGLRSQPARAAGQSS